MACKRNVPAFAALALLWHPVHAQTDVAEFIPASGWSLDYADDSCALRRSFVAGERSIYLEMRQYSPFAQLRITVASAQLNAASVDPQFQFGSDGTPQHYRLSAYGAYGEGMLGVSFYGSVIPEGVIADGEALTTAQYSARLDEREAAISGLRLENSFGEAVVLQTGSLGTPMQALRECMTNLVESWGAGTFLSDPGATMPEAINQTRWARLIQARAPTSLLGRSEPPVIVMRLLIDAEGVTTSCFVQQPVVDQIYEDFVCEAAMRGRHRPARDSAGNPVPSFRLVTIMYGR